MSSSTSVSASEKTTPNCTDISFFLLILQKITSKLNILIMNIYETGTKVVMENGVHGSVTQARITGRILFPKKPFR